jgi:raffinose/stachyose/melibiose transport system permease protein
MYNVSSGMNVPENPQSTHSYRHLQDKLIIFLFLFPSTLIFLVFVIYPIFQSIYYSLFNWKGFGPAVDFVALDNYKRILTDRVFITAVRNNLIIVGLSLILQLPLSLGLAILVGRDLPGRAFFRSIFFMPYVFYEVIAAIMWLSLFNPDPERGFINALLILIP